MMVVQPFPAFLTLSERGGMKKGKEGRKGDPHPSIAAVVGALSVGGGGGEGGAVQCHSGTLKLSSGMQSGNGLGRYI